MATRLADTRDERDPRVVELEIREQDLKPETEHGVEVLDLNDTRNRVKKSTWYEG